MTFRHSLRFRIIFTFSLFGALLGTVFAIAVYISLDKVDDHLIDRQLKEEVERFSIHYQKKTTFPPPISSQISAFVGTEKMPSSFKEMIKGFTPGIYEINTDEKEFHVAIANMHNQAERLHLFLDVSQLEFTEKRKFTIGFVLIAGVLLITTLALWIGWVTSRGVISPVIKLSTIVETSDPNKLHANFSKGFYDDEVGVLAKGFENAMGRLETLIAREHRFCRYVSHELRTPVTIIKGAVALLNRQTHFNEDDRLRRPLKRIERALTNMENIIVTLLWLSREDEKVKTGDVFEVAVLVREIIDQNRYLIGNKPVDIVLIIEAKPRLNIPRSLFQIAVTNLIRNAIQFTPSGNIEVILENDRVIVKDCGRGMDSEKLAHVTRSVENENRQTSSGLGLSIVKRLCHRLNWNLVIESEEGQGTIVQLIFTTGKA